MNREEKQKELGRCRRLLRTNGWMPFEELEKYICYGKRGSINININRKEMVFIDGTGDFLHLATSYYALIGALIQFGQFEDNNKIELVSKTP